MDNFLAGILQNIIADILVLLGATIIALLISLRAKFRLFGAIRRLVNSGVSNVYTRRSEYISRRSRSVNEFIESATRDFTYVGAYFSLATEHSRIDRSLKALIAKGCKIKIVLLDEASPPEIIAYLEDHFAFGRDTLSGRVRHAVDYFLALRNSLAPGVQSYLEIRLHKLPVTASVFIMDANENGRAMLVDQKWYAAGRDKSLGIEFSEKKDDDSLQEAIYSSFAAIIANSRAI